MKTNFPILRSVLFQKKTLPLIVLMVSLLSGCGGGGGGNGGGGGTSPDPTTTDTIPTVDAGQDQIVDEYSTVQLAGMGSDAESDITYLWEQTAGLQVELSDTAVASPMFTAPPVAVQTETDLTFSLTIADGTGNSVNDEVTITIVSNDYIAYIANEDKVKFRDLFLYDVETGEKRKLNPELVEGGNVKSFRWSPNRSHIAYVADQEIDGLFELYVTSIEGGAEDVVKVSVPDPVGSVFSPAYHWSPDGSTIAYLGDQNSSGQTDLYTAERDGSNRLRHSGPKLSGGEVTFDFYWSPDSTRLLFRSENIVGDGSNLYAVTVDGSDPEPLNPPLVENGSMSSLFAWTNLGDKVVYLAEQEEANVQELFAVNADGTDVVKLNQTLVEDGQVQRFYLAPNGEWVVYVADQDQDQVFELFSVRLDGSERTRLNPPLVEGGSVKSYQVQWAADSSRVVYVADAVVEGEFILYSTTPDGSDHRRLDPPVVIHSSVDRFNLAPDGSRVAYTADLDTDEMFELYSVALDGTDHIKLNPPFMADDSIFNVVKVTWSPDSSAIIYGADADIAGAIELYHVSANGENQAKLNAPLTGAADVYDDFNWSSDSSRIAYRVDAGTDDLFELYMVEPNGAGHTKINDQEINLIEVDMFSWSPTPGSESPITGPLL